jgi:hypothetical protein
MLECDGADVSGGVDAERGILIEVLRFHDRVTTELIT